MFCNKCGGQIPIGNNTCPNCGNIVNNETSHKNNPIIIFGVIIAIIIIGTTLVSSLSPKTIICKSSETQSDINIITTITTTFKMNKINNITLEANYNIGSKYSSYIDTFYKEIDKEFEEYKNFKNINYNINRENNNIVVTIEADRISAEKLFNTKFEGTNENPNNFMKAAEANKYTCAKI